MEDLVMAELFNNIYKSKKVLLTGHTGFKGSWLQLWLNQLGANVSGFSLAPNTSPSHFQLLNPAKTSVIGDINDATAIKNAMVMVQPDIVFHLAAQPLVRRSYFQPLQTFQTNVMGTVNLFEAIREVSSVKAIVNVTTDKVYQNIEEAAACIETDILGGHDPYSTSKACVELVHASYRKSFFSQLEILSATARAGNVIGGGDWAEDRLIPDLIRSALLKNTTAIRNPFSVRPWQHVLDPLSGYLLLGQHLLEGKKIADDSWNFGPQEADCLPVKEVLDLFTAHWDGINWTSVPAQEALHESGILRLDCSKAKNQLGWMPVWNILEAIEKTADWYKHYYSNGSVETLQQLNQYIADATGRKAVWTA
jgi:CDP-glucose 4,6-dehydratase